MLKLSGFGLILIECIEVFQEIGEKTIRITYHFVKQFIERVIFHVGSFCNLWKGDEKDIKQDKKNTNKKGKDCESIDSKDIDDNNDDDIANNIDDDDNDNDQ